jgi:hypothetical protein
MLVALPQFPKEELLASLLLFRLLYYITPFTLALMLVGGRELWASVANRTGLEQPKTKSRVAATAIKRKTRKSPSS